MSKTTAAVERFLHALPKVELHCHLLGSVRQQTFRELAHAAVAPLGDDEITAFYTRGDKPVGVLRVLRALERWLLRSADDLHRITYEYLQDAAAHQVRYAEIFWNPTGTAREGGLPYARALPGVLRAFADAQRDFGIEGRLIAAIDREGTPEEALQMVQGVLQHRADAVLGIGIDYREVDRPPELFAAAYTLARQQGLKTTAHAGEFGMPWRNVQTAVETLQVDRVDHGYTVVETPAADQAEAAAFARRCGERGLIFTVVPTNSYYLRSLPPARWAADHPIRRMPAAGLRIHPNTDDPTLHHVTPTGAWLMMHRDFGFDLQALRGFMLNGVDAAWVDEGTRARWRLEFTQAFDRLQRLHQL